MSRFYSLVVTAVQRDTRDAVVLTLRTQNPEDKSFFEFTQGQYLTFRKHFDGEEIRRSYSICAAVQDDTLRVAVKKVAGGLFSTWANEKLKAGDVLEAMPPAGNFHVPLDKSQRKHYLAFACGSGITPVFSLLKTTLLAEPGSFFTLVYGNRGSSTVMFREALEDLKNCFLGRLNLIHILSREQQDIELFNGHINRQKCERLFRHWLDIHSVDQVFICGPQAMMLEVSEALQDQGMHRGQIKFELFATDPLAPKKEKKAEAQTGADQADRCDVKIILDGRARSFQIRQNSETLLAAGLRHGLELPHSCTAGVCSTCRAMLVEGEVDMDVNFALEDYEIARGFILACQSYPVSKKIVVNYDML